MDTSFLFNPTKLYFIIYLLFLFQQHNKLETENSSKSHTSTTVGVDLGVVGVRIGTGSPWIAFCLANASLMVCLNSWLVTVCMVFEGGGVSYTELWLFSVT